MRRPAATAALAASRPGRSQRFQRTPCAHEWTRGSHTARAAASPTSEWGPPPAGTPVFACMSGGVDSSVAARLLLEQGYDVKPVFMRNWDTLDEQSGSGGCEWERDWDDVRRICREHLGGVEPELVDLSREYWTHVFEPALEEWAAGVTPNPDVTCNQCAQCNFLFFFPLPSRLQTRSLIVRSAFFLICMLPWNQAHQVPNPPRKVARTSAGRLDRHGPLRSPAPESAQRLGPGPLPREQHPQRPVTLSLDIAALCPRKNPVSSRRLCLQGRRARFGPQVGNAYRRQEGQHGDLLCRSPQRFQQLLGYVSPCPRHLRSQ